MKSIYPNPVNLGSALARLSRPQNIICPGLLALFSCYLAGGDLAKSLLCYAFIYMIYTVAVTFNNLSDLETDKINKHTGNPIASGELTQRQAKIFLAVMLVLFLILQIIMTQPVSIIIGAAYAGLMYLYSSGPDFKSKSWLGILLLTVCYGVLPVLLGLFQVKSSLSSDVYSVLVLQILLLFPILLAKDYKDIKGDRATGKNTPLVVHGAKVVRSAAYLIAIISVVYCAYLLFDGWYFWSALLLPAYALFVYRLHSRKGVINIYVKKLGMLLILVIGLIALNYLA